MPYKKNGKWTPGLEIKALGILILIYALALGTGAVDSASSQWVFSHMTSAQHLWEAKKTTPEIVDVNVALRHLSAIPSNAPEAQEAQVLRTALQKKMAEMENARAEQHSAQTEKQAEQKIAVDARAAAVSELGVELKNLGYDLSVNANSDKPDEIVITASEFDDTDHRVRFLSFIRGKNSPASGACVNGFSKIRLRGSNIPFFGFDEAYSLNCFSF